MSYRGINYGQFTQNEDGITLLSHHNGRPILSLNYKNISNSIINKNDVAVQTIADVGSEDCLCEIRFHIEEPKEDKEERSAEKNIEQEKEEMDEGINKETTAQFIYRNIVQRAKIGQFAGESLATLLDVNLAVPRGKYTIDFYQKNIRFHGLTFNYNIEYRNITRGFILPMTNEAQVSIVLQLNKDKPIFQGQTVYRYIVIQIKKDINVDIKTKVSPETLQKSPNLKELKAQYSGPQFQVFVDLFHAISGINLVQPGNNFKSTGGQPCVKANVKAQPGWLYMLKSSIIFINKPVLYFRIDDINNVEFHRINTSNKQFDLKIALKDQKKVVEFMGIERGELDSLVEYFKSRQVKVLKEATEQGPIAADAEDDESEDEDFEAGQESEDDDDEDSEIDEVGSEQQSSDKNKKKKIKEDKENKEQAKPEE